MKRFAILTVVLTAVITLLLPFIGGSGPALTSSYASASNGTAAIFASTARASSAHVSAAQISQAHISQARTSNAHASTTADGIGNSIRASRPVVTIAATTVDTEHLGQKPVPVPVVVAPAPMAAAAAASSAGSRSSGRAATTRSSGTATAQRPSAGTPAAGAGGSPAAATACATSGGGGGSAPGGSESGIGGTTSGDIQSFAATFNAIRIAHCLQPIAAGNFRYDSCMEQRLYWMGEDPSADPGNTWGHSGVRSIAPAADGVYYSDSVPAKGCDGNLAGGSGNSGATVAQKWWDSLPHRTSLYRPSITGSTAGVCIFFAMTHGGVPNDGSGFARASARWGGC